MPVFVKASFRAGHSVRAYVRTTSKLHKAENLARALSAKRTLSKAQKKALLKSRSYVGKHREVISRHSRVRYND